jgi:cytochrome oxidase Cu insertion factor (SCO1/SenC/PrrC family)
MKKVIYLALIALFSVQLNACSTSQGQEENIVVNPEDEKIEVYYFHFTRRCATCNAVEEVTKNTLNELFAEKIENEEIVFLSVNLDEDGNKEIAEKIEVSAQALIFVYGDKKIDLTNDGFMNAKNNPDKLKIKIKETINSLLAG